MTRSKKRFRSMTIWNRKTMSNIACQVAFYERKPILTKTVLTSVMSIFS